VAGRNRGSFAPLKINKEYGCHPLLPVAAADKDWPEAVAAVTMTTATDNSWTAAKSFHSSETYH
jgi:hypothetical protein